jgi:hypothetical protein
VIIKLLDGTGAILITLIIIIIIHHGTITGDGIEKNEFIFYKCLYQNSLT